MAKVWIASFGVLVLATTLLAGCEQSTANAAPAAKPAKTKLVAARGSPKMLTPVANDPQVQAAASVVELDDVVGQGDNVTARMFGTAGGDPAANGLFTYLAFIGGGEEETRVFFIGDILNYKILSASPGRIDLEIRESDMRSDGRILTKVRNVIVSWSVARDVSSPSRISITPAT
jgi:hypothetical protein